MPALSETNPMIDAWQQLWTMQADAMAAYADAAGRMRAALFGLRVGDITVYFPFGRGYQQVIEPATNWGIIESAKTEHPDVEQEIVEEVVSYGGQIGRMMELLLSMAAGAKDVDAAKLVAVQELERKIDGVKRKHGLA